MGTYTQLRANIILSKEAPLDIIEKLSSGEMWEELSVAKFGRSEGMFSVSEEPELPIEHIFGKSHRWSQIFSANTSRFNKETRVLKIKCDIKAYDFIYTHLVDWLKPYIESGIIKTQDEWQDSEDWTQLYPE